MADRTVTIRISAEDNFSTVMNKYKSALDQAKTATSQIGSEAKKNTGFIAGLSEEVKLAAVGFGAMGVAKVGLELNKIGIDANKTKEVFLELTKGIGGYENVLSGLQRATGGVVDNTLLMKSSNKLLLSGLAENQTELTKIIELATKLGSAMGEDAGTSIEQFSLMLLNQSIPRLDTFGISGATVRKEMEKLISTGQALNREEAFKMAVFEQGAKALDKLGNSANAAVTELSKLETAWANTTQIVGGRVAEGTEGLAGMTNNAGNQDFIGSLATAVRSEITGEKITDIDSTRQEVDDLQAELTEQAAKKEAEQAAKWAEKEKVWAEHNRLAEIEKRQEKLQNRIDIRRRAESEYGFGDQSFDPEGFMGGSESQNEIEKRRIQELSFDSLFKTSGGYADRFKARNTKGIQFSPDNFYEYGLEEIMKNRTSHEQVLGQRREMLAGLQSGMSGGAMTMDRMMAPIMAQMQRGVLGASTGLNQMDVMGRLSARTQEGFDAGQGNMGLMTDKSIDDTIERAEKLQNIYEEIQANPFISDADKERMAAIAESAGELANKAQQAREAFDNMKLDQMLGKGDGGRRGEMTDMIMENLSEDADKEKIQEEFDLGTGRETGLSLRTKNVYAPLLARMAETQGAGGALKTSDAVLRAIEQGQMEGLSEDQIIGNANVQMFKGAAAPMLEKGQNVIDFFGRAFGGSVDEGEGVAMEGEDAMEGANKIEIEADTTEAEANLTALEKTLAAITNSRYSVSIDVKYNDPGAPTGDGSRGSTGTDVRNNGGSVPGQDPRTPMAPIG